MEKEAEILVQFVARITQFSASTSTTSAPFAWTGGWIATEGVLHSKLLMLLKEFLPDSVQLLSSGRRHSFYRYTSFHLTRNQRCKRT
jgi:hypothetical protein